jgi:gentisate 1,2-dioxygenase
MMNRNIEYYAKKYNILDEEICKKTIQELEQFQTGNSDTEGFAQHQFYNSRANKVGTRSGDQELDITFKNTTTTKPIMDKMWYALRNYLDDLDMPWFNEWQGYSTVRYNRYTKSRKMALHCDHIQSLFDGNRKGIPILSALGVLNDDYEGGEFVMFDEHKIKLDRGDLLIFPSNFMYPHRVEPVTKGVRYSYISWVW